MSVITEHKLKDIRTGYSGFNRLSALANDALSVSGCKVIIDCSELTWFDAHMAAPLMAIIRQSEANDNIVKFRNLNNKTKIILQKNGFFSHRIDDIHGTTIELEEFEISEQKIFSKYVEENLQAQDLPNMSLDLKEKFYEGVDEIFTNSVIHSKTKNGIFACGQFFPRDERLDFAITDAGIGVREVIYKKLGLEMDAVQAVEWALTGKNTTRQGDIPGGLGLKLIREFITLNGGKFLIVSNDGFWSMIKGRISKKKLDWEFPGTTTILEINTSDTHSYYLEGEILPDEIF
jgi:anti-anti-sigma regulatory factor